MKTYFADTPRVFDVNGVEISDQGAIELEPNEMISLRTASGRLCEVTAMPWGFYLGSSHNSRMKHEGFRTALVVNSQNKLFINAVEENQFEAFHTYLLSQGSRVVRWLDEEER